MAFGPLGMCREGGHRSIFTKIIGINLACMSSLVFVVGDGVHNTKLLGNFFYHFTYHFIKKYSSLQLFYFAS